MGHLFLAQVNAWVSLSVFLAFAGRTAVKALRDYKIRRLVYTGPVGQVYALTQLGNDQGLPSEESFKAAREFVLELQRLQANAPPDASVASDSLGDLDAPTIVNRLIDRVLGPGSSTPPQP